MPIPFLCYEGGPALFMPCPGQHPAHCLTQPAPEVGGREESEKPTPRRPGNSSISPQITGRPWTLEHAFKSKAGPRGWWGCQATALALFPALTGSQLGPWFGICEVLPVPKAGRLPLWTLAPSSVYVHQT